MMDEIDKKILKRLQQNARVTISVLSQEISLSMPAISERLKKLEASGVIKQYTALLDPSLIKKEMTALIFLGFDRPSNGDIFREKVAEEADIKECFYITGDYDYVLKVVTENTQSLEALLSRIKENPGMIKTETIIVLSTIVDKLAVTID